MKKPSSTGRHNNITMVSENSKPGRQKNVGPDAIARELDENPENMELAERLYAESTAVNQFRKAEQTFQGILERMPHLHHLRRLLIASFLQQGKYEPAMASIEILMAFSNSDDGLIDSALQVRRKIGPKVVPPDRMDAGSLSLCMIVRNEQRFLAPCLNAAKNMVDEMVIVDTGSDDRTPDIARAFGAVVHQFVWEDDFSRARNHALKHAHGNWILVLDADEIVAQRDQDKLRNLLQRYKQLDAAFSIETRNYTHVANTVNLRANTGEYPRHETGLGWFPSRKIRLFPNSADIRFHFPVHELVDPSVKSAGLTVIESDIPVHHYGCLNEGKANQKAEAYFRLGYSKLDRLGDDVAALRELAVQAGQLGYWPEALELWQRLLTLRPDYAEAYVNMAAAYWQTGKYQQSLESAQRACHLAPQMKEAAYNLAVSLLMLGNAERAADVLTELLGTHGDYLAAHFMLASASGCAGDTDRSIRLYRQLKQMPVGEALEAAIADLQQRLRGGGLNPYADALDLAKRRM